MAGAIQSRIYPCGFLSYIYGFGTPEAAYSSFLLGVATLNKLGCMATMTI